MFNNYQQNITFQVKGTAKTKAEIASINNEMRALQQATNTLSKGGLAALNTQLNQASPDVKKYTALRAELGKLGGAAENFGDQLKEIKKNLQFSIAGQGGMKLTSKADVQQAKEYVKAIDQALATYGGIDKATARILSTADAIGDATERQLFIKEATPELQTMSSLYDQLIQKQEALTAGAGEYVEKFTKTDMKRRMPTFLQFALFPAASLANRAGATGLGEALFGASDVAGVVDQASSIRGSLKSIGEGFREADNVFGKVATKIGDVISGFTGVSGAMGSVLGVAGALAIAVAVLGEVMRQQQLAFQKQVDQAKAYVSGRLNVADQITGGATTTDIQDFRTQQQGLLNNRRAVRDGVGGIVDEYNSGGILNQGGLAKAVFSQRLAQMTGGEITNIDAAAEALKGLNTEITNLEADVRQSTVALENDATAQNDAAAQREATSERITQLLTAQTQAEMEAAEFAQAATQKTLDEKIRALQAEYTMLQEDNAALINLGGQASAAQIDVNVQRQKYIQSLNVELEKTRDLVAARDTAQAGFDQLAKIGQELLDSGRQGAEATAKYAEESTEIRKKFDEDMFDLDRRYEDTQFEAEQKLQFDREKALRDRDDDLADLEEKAADKEKDLEEKFNDDGLKRKLDHERRLADIERDFNRSAANAIASRDALAYYLARQKRDDDIKSENERYAALNAERKRDYDRQRKELKDNLEQQKRDRERDYQRRLRELKISFEFEAAQRKQKYIADQVLLNQALNAELTLQSQAYQREINALSSHLTGRYALENSYYTAVSNRIAQLFGSVPQASSSTSSGSGLTTGYTPSQYAAGGRTPAFEEFTVGENGRETLRLPVRGQVFNNQQTRQMQGGGVNVGIGDIYGSSVREIIRVVDERLEKTLLAAGVQP